MAAAHRSLTSLAGPPTEAPRVAGTEARRARPRPVDQRADAGRTPKTDMPIDPHPDICGGRPRLAGRRLTVHNVVSLRWRERDLPGAMRDFDLRPHEVEEARRYCAELRCLIDPRRLQFCEQCVLDRLAPIADAEALRERILDEGEAALVGRAPESMLKDPYRCGWAMAWDPPGAGA